MNSKMFAASVLVASVISAGAAVTPATPFADGMVLQRGRKVPVWGKADAGENVAVAFAGQTKNAKAAADGSWRVDLDPLEACCEGRELKIGDKVIKDVLVGEVWLASGQSNMECPIWGGSPRYRDWFGPEMTAIARRPGIRFVKIPREQTKHPKLFRQIAWRPYSAESFLKGEGDDTSANQGVGLSGVGFYYALTLHDALKVPVGIVDVSWGGSRIEPWTPPAGGMWNGMVAAFAPMAARGFIWYQGCSNAGDGLGYVAKMHALYKGWAKQFENPDLSFYFVQLAPFSRTWFTLQLAQAQFAAEEPHAAMATTCDIGNSWDIHPNNKEPVARRLALHALKRDYGFKGVMDEPPVLKSHRVTEKGEFALTFQYAKNFYFYNANGSEPAGFEVAGEDGVFYPARVVNRNNRGTLAGGELLVKSDKVAKPAALRYLYQKPWIGSIYSVESGLPIGPFYIGSYEDRVPAPTVKRRASAKFGDALKLKELEGFKPLYTLDIPGSAAFHGYGQDNANTVRGYSRVAYVLELERFDGECDYALTIMDSFSANPVELGVPAASRAFFQRKVAKLTVRSNIEGVQEKTDAEGGFIEFFNSNYATQRGVGDLPGDDNVYDINDKAISPDVGYGSMQVNDLVSGRTIWAYNNFNHGGSSDIGIGASEGQTRDWTFCRNACAYRARRLSVFVR